MAATNVSSCPAPIRLPAILALLLVHAWNIGAHDIGVSRTELIEQPGNRYVLKVATGTTTTQLFPPPTLPEGFEWSGPPRNDVAGDWKTFPFQGDRALNADDELVLPWRRARVLVTARWLDGTTAKVLAQGDSGTIRIPLADLRAGSGSWTSAARRYTTLGIEHILLGVDHLLFVLGLLWIVKGGMQLVKTITAFTVAHSISLALAALGWVHVPTAPVDACIALSIMFLGVEILHARQGRFGLAYRYPWVVAFAFGLLHGLGFAGALTGIGLPPGEIPHALLFFNVGVEIGQLMFVLVFLLLGWAHRRLEMTFPKWSEAIPAYGVGTIASFWFLARITTLLP